MRRWIAVGVCSVACAALMGCAGDDLKIQYLARGDRFFAEGKYAEATIEYANAVKRDPRFGLARFGLAQAYAKTDQPQRAFGEYVRAADLLPGNRDAQVQAITYLLVAGRFEDAKTRAEKLLERNPKDISAQVLLGNALAGLQDLDRAVTQIQEAIELEPNRSGSYMNLAALLFARRNPVAAERAFQKATLIAPRSADTHLALANYYWASGRMAEAEQKLADAARVEPRHVGANRALAIFYLASNRAADAERHFKAVADISGTALSRLALADYYLLTKRASDALPILDDIVRDPRTFGAASARLAAMHHSQGRRDQAYQTIDEALQREPKNKVVILIKARLLLADGKPDEALPIVEAAIAVDPRWAPAHYTLGSIHVARRDYKRAENAFSQVLRLNPRAVAAQLQLSQLYLQDGGVESSVSLAQEAVAAQPGNALTHLLLARALMARGDLDEAEARMQRLIEQLPTSAPVHAQMGTLLLLKKDEAGAARFFTRAAQLDPGLIEALTGLVTLDINQRRIDSARERIARALETRANDPAVLLLASGVYVVANDMAAAEDSLRRLIDVDPSNLRAYGQLALLYYRQNKLPQALVEFERMSKRQTKSVAPETMLGMILQVSDRLRDAEPHYERALTIDSSVAGVAANNLAWLYAESGGSLDSALQLAQTAKLQLPDLPEVDHTLGWVYYRKELYRLAVPRLEESVRKAPGNPTYRLHLGLAYVKQGDVTKARETLQQVLALSPNGNDAAEARKALAALTSAPARRSEGE
jgi:putative PEP-CTERM system TPR-repeat lipoprotein